MGVSSGTGIVKQNGAFVNDYVKINKNYCSEKDSFFVSFNKSENADKEMVMSKLL
ncbi:hypothetical cytosolic protein [Syntrophus aciditrophicus SB]|uniref:Hypothetical cytosolic protein n=1 Tax=Syntrophus aciditrophicus (strain SB) TaxID=56780 RepID=Q2LTV3_SYNAS|nr:hypothetical cytosolic protein [Syntrophus aciditrophicus SB]